MATFSSIAFYCSLRHLMALWLHGSSWLVMVSDDFWNLLTAFNGSHFPPPTPDGCVWVHMVYEGSVVSAGSGWLQLDCEGFQRWFTASDQAMAPFGLMATDTFIWLSIASCCSFWLLMAHNEFMASAGFQWLPIDFYGSLWLLIAL